MKNDNISYISLLIKPFVSWGVGKCLLHKLGVKKNDYIILLPEHNSYLNQCVFSYIDEYAKKKYARSIVIVSLDEIDSKIYADKSFVKKVICGNEKLINYLQKERFFINRLNVIDLYSEENVYSTNLIGVSEIDLESIVKFCYLELFD